MQCGERDRLEARVVVLFGAHEQLVRELAECRPLGRLIGEALQARARLPTVALRAASGWGSSACPIERSTSRTVSASDP